MGMPTPHLPVPRMEAIGTDLLVTTRLQLWLALGRPFLGLAAYAVAVYLGWWCLTPVIAFLIFITVIRVVHDAVHGALGLGPRQTDWALFLFGAVLLESAHAFRLTHLQHHRVFPGPDDPEGDPARMSFWRAVRHGPWYLPRLWWWAYRRLQGRRRQRCWLLAEAASAVAFVLIGLALWPWTAAVLAYAGMMIVGGWIYPLLTVYLPHHDYGDSPLTYAGTARGRILPALFLQQTYHLEHHFYPKVPSHHLPALAGRLDPYLRQVGVQPRRVL